MGVVLIAFAAFAVTVPVLHWLDRGAMAVAAATSDSVRFCPHCGRKLAGEIGVELECGRCGRGFSVAPIV
jgi:NADH pyrophosphatase NudC (nudix superfamily)